MINQKVTIKVLIVRLFVVVVVMSIGIYGYLYRPSRNVNHIRIDIRRPVDFINKFVNENKHSASVQERVFDIYAGDQILQFYGDVFIDQSDVITANFNGRTCQITFVTNKLSRGEAEAMYDSLAKMILRSTDTVREDHPVGYESHKMVVFQTVKCGQQSIDIRRNPTHILYKISGVINKKDGTLEYFKGPF